MFGFFRGNDAPAPQFIDVPAEQHPQRYCGDLHCNCHYDAAYHDGVTGLQEPSEVELSEALKFWQIMNA